jgi:hypothetical protein
MSEPEKRSRQYLPEVLEGVGGALVRNMTENGDIPFMEEVLEKFNREQPYLSDAIGDAMETLSRSKHDYNMMGIIVLFMYELLSEQAEADAMQRLLDLPSNE